MHTIEIVSVGKNKEPWLQEAWDIYAQRLQNQLKIQVQWFKTTSQLDQYLEANPETLLLDPKGLMQDSKDFKNFLWTRAQHQKGKISIAIGPDEGFSTDQRNKASQNKALLSFSPMTLTHQMCRLMLIEQVYRAVQIDLGTPYHK